jgi:hypothetical protein
MRQLNTEAGQTAVTLADAQAALPYPPVPANIAYVGAKWNGPHGSPPEFDLEAWAPATNNITAGTLYSGALHPTALVVGDDVDTVDFANNELDLTGHAMLTGDGPVQLTTTDTLPTGLALATDYYVIYVGVNTIQLATSLENALAGTAVAFTDGGVGTHTVTGEADCQRIHWHAYKLLGLAEDGAVPLTLDKGYRARYPHSPRTIAYSAAGTLSASVANVALYPIFDVYPR